ncbi:interleukin-8-like [Heterodontus francisci]|uniref:interleukin-8-like n=1 Tax=Heterodontus francisci TaxID=7792 RepID=UPI00355BD33D
MTSRATFITLTILVLSGFLTDALAIGQVKTGLRCKCIKTTSDFIAPKYMKNVEIIPHGPHCHQVEIIATLKRGVKTCLNPDVHWVKKIIKKILQWYILILDTIKTMHSLKEDCCEDEQGLLTMFATLPLYLAIILVEPFQIPLFEIHDCSWY